MHLLNHLKKPIISYVMVGDGGFEASYQYAKTLIESGIQVLELGMPFSDPAADGPTISDAGKRAIAEGTTFNDVLKLAEILKRETHVSLIVMTYYNVLIQYGLKSALEAMIQVGIEGVIIPDLPFEHHEEVKCLIQGRPFHLVSMVAINTDEERLKKMCKASSGMIYLVTVKGITGSQRPDFEAVKEMSEKIKRYTKTPVVAGFGIESKKDIKRFNQYVDGVVIASHFIKLRQAGRLNEIKNIVGI